jgi:hypothetical protein
MNAAQARAKSTVNAIRREKEREEKNRKARLSAARAKVARSKKFIAKTYENLKRSISYRVEGGEKLDVQTLSSDHHDRLAGEFKYAPDGKSIYGADNYFKYAEFRVELKKVLARLRREGFKCDVVGERVEHDERAAWANSDGACGSNTLYWTDDTILRITW